MKFGQRQKNWFKMSKVLTPGELAPNFELKDVQGNRVRLSDFRGKLVVLAFLRGFM